MTSCRVCLVLFAIPVALLSIVFSPQPEFFLGADYGLYVRKFRNLAKIVVFMEGISPASLHPQLQTLAYVVEHMKAYEGKDHAEKVLDLVDEHAWGGNMLINIGDVKGKILDKAILDRKKPIGLAVELGTFVGYGTIRLARLLKNKTEIVTVDPDPFAYAVSSSLWEQAKVRERITNKIDYSDKVLRQFAKQGKKIDFLFIDHVKHLYLPDLKLALELGVLAKDATIVGDNVRFPGAPDFKEFLLSDEGKKRFETTVYDSHVEYMPSLPDQVTISTYLG